MQLTVRVILSALDQGEMSGEGADPVEGLAENSVVYPIRVSDYSGCIGNSDSASYRGQITAGTWVRHTGGWGFVRDRGQTSSGVSTGRRIG